METASSWRRDTLVAMLLAGLLGAVWAWRDWSDLSALRLPDTDDVMRLQQVRDWLGGQAFGDLRQYRLGPPGGTAMHWSRVADLPIAALILLLRPLLGSQPAEVAAVAVWPVMLFAAYLMLVAAVARRMAIGSGAAMIVGALAYPVTTLFVPGRIDHHGLQVVLLLACVHGLVAPPSRWRGVTIGAAMIASIAIGFEMVASLAAIGLWAACDWLRGGDRRLEGVAVGLGGCGLAAIGLVPASAPPGLCDALSLPIAGVLAGCGAALLLGIILHRVMGIPRFAVLAASAGLILLLLALLAPAGCRAGPYAAVDPLAVRLWLGHVAEAQPLFAAPPADAIGYAGLSIVALVVAASQAWRSGGAWWGLAALIAVALAVTCWQLRGAYAAAALAPIPLARMIAAARARGGAAVATAWIAAAGALYPLAAGALPTARRDAVAPCDAAAAVALLRALPPGRVAAPVDLAPAILLDTRSAALAGPYHRDGAGNAALYRILLSDPRPATRLLRDFGIAYIVWCPGAVGGLSTADALARRGAIAGYAAIGREGGVTVLARR